MKYLSVVVFFAFLQAFPARADHVADFYQSIKSKTYNCPADDSIEQVDAYLQELSNENQAYGDLLTHKTHWLICRGENSKAKTLLNEWLARKQYQTDSRAYGSAQLQLGFLLDQMNDPQGCPFYQNALASSTQRKDDVYLSARLGLLTLCAGSEDVARRLAGLYILLEEFSTSEDKAAIATIHNRLGVLYGNMGQNRLAAEQYDKVHKLAQQAFDAKNQLPSLLSAISAYSASGEFDITRQRLDELEKANLVLNTPYSNMVLRFFTARQYYRTGDMQKFRESMAKWRLYLDKEDYPPLRKAFESYSTVLCIEQGDLDCVQAYIDKQEALPEEKRKRYFKSRDYGKVLIDSYLVLQDFAKAREALADFLANMEFTIARQQSSARVLGIANHHAKIMSLEANLAEAQRERQWLIAGGGFIVVILLIGALLLARYRYYRGVDTDALTGVSNRLSILRAVKRMPAAEVGKTNALVLFDVNNFKDVNSQFGHTNADAALKDVAKCLSKVLRGKDMIGRIGGQQFLLCLSNVEESIARQLYQRMQDALATSIFSTQSGDMMDVQSSTSIYFTSDDFSDIDDVLSDLQLSLQQSSSRI